MSKSFIGVSLGGLVLIASSILAFALGASIGQRGDRASLLLASSEVRFEPARDMVESIDDALAPAGVPGVFVYQGVLTDSNGDPATGMIDLTFTLQSNLPQPVTHSMIQHTVEPDEFGRFQVDIPLADPMVMINSEDLLIDCRENGAMNPIAVVPVQHTPRAWTAEHARTSVLAVEAAFAEFAETAQDANFALEAFTAQSATNAENANNANNATNATNAQTAVSAQTADALTNDNTVTLSLNAPFSVYGNGYEAPEATRVGNVVHLSGLVDVDATINNTAMTTLPVGMWPTGRIILSVNTQSTLYQGAPPRRFDVLPNGQIFLFQQINENDWFSLDGLSFIVD